MTQQEPSTAASSGTDVRRGSTTLAIAYHRHVVEYVRHRLAKRVRVVLGFRLSIGRRTHHGDRDRRRGQSDYWR
jgi:hypothetical protein